MAETCSYMPCPCYLMTLWCSINIFRNTDLPIYWRKYEKVMGGWWFLVLWERDFDLLHGRTCSLTQPANDIIVWWLSSISGDYVDCGVSPRLPPGLFCQYSTRITARVHCLSYCGGEGREGEGGLIIVLGRLSHTCQSEAVTHQELLLLHPLATSYPGQGVHGSHLTNILISSH